MEPYLPAAPLDVSSHESQYCVVRDAYMTQLSLRTEQVVCVSFSSELLFAWRASAEAHSLQLADCFKAVRTDLRRALQAVVSSSSTDVFAATVYVMKFVVAPRDAGTAHGIIAEYFADKHVNVRIYPA